MLVMAEDAGKELSNQSPCGLYVHVPFCRSKCGYCDFYSVVAGAHDTARLIDCLGGELTRRVAEGSHRVRTVFCGGGTPTILPMDELAALLESVERAVATRDLAEFSIEANPATVDDDKAGVLVAAGITRVSMGAQSFFADELAALDRHHLPQDIAPSVEILRRHGVPQINLDLIFGIPGQTLETWAESLRRAIDLQPDHLACYGLTYEPGTRLTARRERGQITPCTEDLEADMYELTMDTLAEAGYAQYEISNYARPGHECQHNLIYWRNEPYLGVGPSAAGCVDHRRYKNVADMDGYIRMIEAHGHAEVESETLDRERLITEMVMMQLRLVEGLSRATFRRRTGFDPLVLFSEPLARLIDLGLLLVSDSHVALTRRGRLVSNAVMAELVSACDGHPDSSGLRSPLRQAPPS